MVVVNLLVKPLYIFGVDRVMQLKLGAKVYGTYAPLLNLAIVLNMLLDMGLTSLNTKNTAEDPTLVAKDFKNLFVIKFALFVFYGVVTIIVGALLHYDKQALHLLFLITIIQGLNSFLQFLRSFYAGNQLFIWDTFLSIGDKLLLIIAAFVIMLNQTLWQSFTIMHYAVLQLICYALVIVIAWFFALNKKLITKSIFNYLDTIKLFKNGLPIALLIFLMAIYLRSDMFILERISGTEAANLYAFCYRQLDAVNMIGFLFAGILLPMFSKNIRYSKNLNDIAKMASCLLIPASIILSMWCFFQAAPILNFLGLQAPNTTITFKLIMLSFPGLCLIHIFCTLLTASYKINTLLLISLVGALLSIVLNLLVDFKYGAIGAAGISLIVNLSIGCAYLFASIHYFKFDFFKSLFLQVVSVVLITFFINYFLANYAIMWSVVANCAIMIGVVVNLSLGKIKQFLNS